MVKGPMPKRSEERTRRNKTTDAGLTLKKGQANGVQHWPEPSEEWVPSVVHLYESLQVSGMARFYEQSDVAMAIMVCDTANAWYTSGKRNANMIMAALKYAAELGATEGERRRMQIELDLPDSGSELEADVVSIQSAKKKVMGA